jgi:hypothetical protein
MSPLLAKRIGPDSISKLEAAASRRYCEATVLRESGQLLGAAYLYGYVAECRLGAAYFRLVGYRPNTEITIEARKRILAAAIQAKLMSAAPHDIAGWAQLLIATRKRRGTGYPAGLRHEIIRKARALYARWRPNLRYRAIVPTLEEVAVVRESAEWFEEHYRRLWS